jgi:very-short-patch-repair endonuclease
LPPHLPGTSFHVSEYGFHQLSRGRLRGRDLDAYFHGIRSIGLCLNDAFDRARIYAPRLHDGQVLCNVTAALLWDIPLPLQLRRQTEVHVGDIRGSKPRARGVIGHLLREVDRRFLEEIPVTSPAQTWCELAAVLSREDLVAAGDYLLSGKRLRHGRRDPPLCSLTDLEEARARFGRQPGAANIRWALPRLRPGVDSRPESLLRLTFVAHRLPEPAIQHPVAVLGGRILHPDLAYPFARLGIEYEGDDHRQDKARWRDDLRRGMLFDDAGWRIVRATQDDIDDPSTIVLAVRRALRRAAAESRRSAPESKGSTAESKGSTAAPIPAGAAGPRTHRRS